MMAKDIDVAIKTIEDNPDTDLSDSERKQILKCLKESKQLQEKVERIKKAWKDMTCLLKGSEVI